MKCEYCGKDAPNDFIKCPHCNSWIPEINKIQTKFYSLFATAACLVIILIMRIKALSVWNISIERVIKDPISIILLVVTVVVTLHTTKAESKLKKLKKGRLF